MMSIFSGVLQRRRDASPSTTTTATTSTTTASQKDYFQVTDELSRENSHFSLSEAMLTVVEQVLCAHVYNINLCLQHSVYSLCAYMCGTLIVCGNTLCMYECNEYLIHVAPLL